MGSRRANITIVMLILALLAASVYVIATKPTKLGLDLSGGIQLIYEGEPSADNPTVDREDIDRTIELLRDRVDAFGVSEPEIAPLGETQIQVGLPDVQDTQRAIEQVGDTAKLYFYDLEPNVVPLDPKVEEVTPENLTQQATTSLYNAVELASKQNTKCNDVCTTTGPQLYLFEKGSREYVAGPESSERDLFSTDAAKAVPKEDRKVLTVPQGTIVVQDQQDDPEATPRYFVLRDRPALSGDDIENPEQSFDQNNAPNVTFDFTDEGRAAFERITRNIAQRGFESLGAPYSFAIVLDGDIVSRPVIDYQENPDGIDGRTGAQISGGFTVQQAQDLATFLKIGALPINLELVSQSTVSPTLGQQALDDGLKAGLIGLLIVSIFFLLYYRFLGAIAILGLAVYAAFFLAIMKLIPITLTLPGIAGLILTIGVAADSNVVVFERIKEEARKGHSMISSITTGYKRGIGTIIDANVITLLTAFILFGLATAGVKGFAFTLGIGTIVSLLTAVVFTRAVLGLLGRSRILRSPAFLGAGEQRVRWHFDFAGASRWFFSISGLILVVGALSFATNQLNFGIDFESGTKIETALAEPVSVDDVRNSLADAGVADVDAVKVQSVENPDFGANVFQIQGTIAPDEVGEVQRQLSSDFGFEGGGEGGFQSQSVGPTFGEQIARSAGYAIAFSLLLIAAYVAFRFEPKYAIPVMIAVIHDILITAGVYSLVGREVTSGTVAAFLTILGYSLYDTIIVFDRVRENVPRLPRATFSQIANRSLSEVLTRSLITGLSTVFLIGTILIFGGETLSDFAFAMMVGVLSGTYSSIFIASPVLIAWKEREPAYQARAARIREQMGRVPAFPEENEVALVGGEPAAAERDGGNGRPVAPESPPPAAASAPRDDGNGAEPAEEPEADAVSAEETDDAAVSERERRLAARRRRQAQRRKHGRNR
ncbi:MAG TPA: protein translocase subunit SecD [Solirubrobacterales bacterium]|nr:protein translocase subunit SecD [Solirubrobacterales bacterium]